MMRVRDLAHQHPERQRRPNRLGHGSAPLVDDTVIVLPGGSDGRSIVGYRYHREARLVSVGDKQAYCSPMLVTLNGVRQLLVVSATRMMGLVPGNGKVLWEYPFPTYNGINAAQPLGDRRQPRVRIRELRRGLRDGRVERRR